MLIFFVFFSGFFWNIIQWSFNTTISFFPCAQWVKDIQVFFFIYSWDTWAYFVHDDPFNSKTKTNNFPKKLCWKSETLKHVSPLCHVFSLSVVIFLSRMTHTWPEYKQKQVLISKYFVHVKTLKQLWSGKNTSKIKKKCNHLARTQNRRRFVKH